MQDFALKRLQFSRLKQGCRQTNWFGAENDHNYLRPSATCYGRRIIQLVLRQTGQKRGRGKMCTVLLTGCVAGVPNDSGAGVRRRPGCAVSGECQVRFRGGGASHHSRHRVRHVQYNMRKHNSTFLHTLYTNKTIAPWIAFIRFRA